MTPLDEPMTRSAAAADLGARISATLNVQGCASVIWSGGRTPKSLIEPLASQQIDWARVTFLMGDERWVPLDSADSNEGEMRRYLAGTPLEATRVAGLYRPDMSRAEAVDVLERDVAALLETPACAALLGMGPDGHTASLFPGGDWLDLPADRLVVAAEGPADNTPERMSLTPAALRRCQAVYLLCNSPEKRDIWMRAQAGADPADLPVAALLRPGAPRPTLVA